MVNILPAAPLGTTDQMSPTVQQSLLTGGLSSVKNILLSGEASKLALCFEGTESRSCDRPHTAETISRISTPEESADTTDQMIDEKYASQCLDLLEAFVGTDETSLLMAGQFDGVNAYKVDDWPNDRAVFVPSSRASPLLDLLTGPAPASTGR